MRVVKRERNKNLSEVGSTLTASGALGAPSCAASLANRDDVAFSICVLCHASTASACGGQKRVGRLSLMASVGGSITLLTHLLTPCWGLGARIIGILSSPVRVSAKRLPAGHQRPQREVAKAHRRP